MANTKNFHADKLIVYEEEVMKIGEEISNLKRLIEHYGKQSWLSYESQVNLDTAIMTLQVKRHRMAVLVERAQARLF